VQLDTHVTDLKNSYKTYSQVSCCTVVVKFFTVHFITLLSILRFSVVFSSFRAKNLRIYFLILLLQYCANSKIVKLFIMQYFPATSYLLSLWSKYSFQYTSRNTSMIESLCSSLNNVGDKGIHGVLPQKTVSSWSPL